MDVRFSTAPPPWTGPRGRPYRDREEAKKLALPNSVTLFPPQRGLEQSAEEAREARHDINPQEESELSEKRKIATP